jgi:inosose dehydratase
VLRIGVATYTLRLWKIDETISLLQKLGIEYASLKDAHLPRTSSPDELRAIVARFRAAGITPLSVGNVGLKNDEADIRSALEYARNSGIGTMVCAPPVEALPLLDKLVKEYDIRLAIHNHGPEDKHFPTPYAAYELIKKLDPRLGLCVDVGHCARGGKDPARAISDCRSRERSGRAKEVGRGILDIPSILRALEKIKFQGNVGFEYEKDEKDPSLGLAESVGYVRGVLKVI